MIVVYESDDILEAYMCAQCNTNQRALFRSDIASSPEMLVLALCRFKRSEQGAFVRNTQRLDLIPPLVLPVRPEIGVENSTVYNVFAVIHHRGNRPDSGHYYADIRRHDKWFRCNDRAVTPSLIDVLGNETAYVIFFKRQGIQHTIQEF